MRLQRVNILLRYSEEIILKIKTKIYINTIYEIYLLQL